MLLDQAALSRIRCSAEENPFVTSAMQSLLETCRKNDEAALDEMEAKAAFLTERSHLGYTKLLRLGNFIRDLSIDCFKTSFAYALTKEQPLLSAVRRMAALVCKADPWLYQGYSDGWLADLWTADIGANMSLCYDTLKAELSDTEKVFLEENILKKSILPIYTEWINPLTHVHALDTMGHNWWSVIVAGAGIGLVCLGKETVNRSGLLDYDKALDDTLDALDEWYRYSGNVLQNKKGNFGPDGDYIEYTGYMLYAFSNLCTLDELLQKEHGDSRLYKEEIFKRIPQFFLAFSYETDDRMGFADFGDTPFSTRTVHPLYYFAGKQRHAQLAAFAQKACPEMQNPLDFYFYPQNGTLKEEALQNTLVYNHAGYAVVRNGYSDDATVFLMKTGDSWNHNHLDVGTFELIDKKHRFVADSGSCSYSNPLYRSYYIKPEAHNIITCSGKGQVEESIYTGTKVQGNFPTALHAKGYQYLLADCTGPYQNIYQRFYRHCLFLDGVIVMIDDIQTLREETLTIQLHTAGDISLLKNGFSLTCGKDVMRVYQFARNGLRPALKEGHLHAIPESAEREEEAVPKKYVASDFETDDLRQKCVTCFLLPSATNPCQSVDIAYLDEAQQITLSYTDGRKDYIWINEKADGRVMHRNGVMVFDRLRTDAFLTYAREKDGHLLRFGMHNGSFLQWEDTMKLSSLLKHDALIDEEAQTLTAAVSSDTRLYVQSDRFAGSLDAAKGEHLFQL